MGLQENSLQENVGQFVFIVFYFAVLTDFGGALITVDVLLTRVSDPLLPGTQREVDDCRVVWNSPASLELGHLSSTGLWALKAQGQSRFLSCLCYF